MEILYVDPPEAPLKTGRLEGWLTKLRKVHVPKFCVGSGCPSYKTRSTRSRRASALLEHTPHKLSSRFFARKVCEISENWWIGGSYSQLFLTIM
jgi:hypothetical protein